MARQHRHPAIGASLARRKAAAAALWPVLRAAVAALFLLPYTARATEPPYNPAGPGQITLSNGMLLRDGRVWNAKGVAILARLAPPKLKGFGGLRQAAARFGPATLSAVKEFGADVVRFPVSEGALDPQSPIYDPDYGPHYVLPAVKMARAEGLSVIIMDTSESGSGENLGHEYPTAATVRAWRTLTSEICPSGDNGIMLNLFNEPNGGRGSPGASDWQDWQRGYDAVVAEVRNAGCRQVLIVQGLGLGKILNLSYPISDPQHSYVWGVHVYFNCSSNCRYHPFSTPRAWNGQFGGDCRASYENARTPCMIDEWALGSSTGKRASGCSPNAPRDAAIFIGWMVSHRPYITGLTVWAFDVGSNVMRDASLTTPTDFTGFTDCETLNPPFGFGQIVSQFYKGELPGTEPGGRGQE